jgi:Reverse transcriptase (RNA-dependent DNA polymerase)
LSGRSQTVIVGSVSHESLPINCGLLQRPVVGPNGFIAYTEEIVETISDFSVSSHQYADDTSLVSHMPLADISTYCVSMERCLLAVCNSFRSRWLQLNANKTELVWFGTRCNIGKIHSVNMSLTFGKVSILPVTCVKYLGVFLDTELNVMCQINRIAELASSSYAAGFSYATSSGPAARRLSINPVQA